MPRSRLTSAETVAIKTRLIAGESIAAVARPMGRSRQVPLRIKGSPDRQEVRQLSVKLNIRIAEDVQAALQALAEASGLTVSEAVRHLVRQASNHLAIRVDQLDAIAAARRALQFDQGDVRILRDQFDQKVVTGRELAPPALARVRRGLKACTSFEPARQA